MKKQTIIQLLVGLLFAALLLFFFLPRWHTALIDKDKFLNYIYFSLTMIAFLSMAFAHGFRFKFLKEKIQKRRINFPGIAGYIFLIYLLLKENSINLVLTTSKVMGVLYVLLLVLIAIAPLYMESGNDKADKAAS